MQIKINRAKSCPAPICCFPTKKPSIRGKMERTQDGVAVVVFAVIMLFFTLFCILSVINNSSESKDENDNPQTKKPEELLFRFFQ